MRAERLITLLLLLERHRERSARELADELGVSVRTVYRDIDALCELGIPIYADRGAAGGYRLSAGYRSELAGLTPDERNALALLDLPEALAQLEVGQHLKHALLKLFVVTSPRQQHILLDWSDDGDAQPAGPVVQRLYEAINQSRTVRLTYRMFGFLEVSVETVPLGLVLSEGAWRLVYATGGRLRQIAVSHLTTVQVLGSRAARPEGFDLKAAWSTLRAAEQGLQPSYEVALRLAPRLSDSALQNAPITESGHDAGGWRLVTARFEHEVQALRTVLGLGGAVEVLAPEALRLAVQDHAVQALRRYGHDLPDIQRR